MRQSLSSLGLVAALASCSGQGGDAPAPGPSGDAHEAPTPSTCTAEAELASPLRRLTRLEYTSSVRDLLGVEVPAELEFPADAVAGGFDNNAALLGVSPLLAEKYLAAAELLSPRALESNPALATCDAGLSDDACAASFVESFGRRAYRRPLVAAEKERLLRAYTAGRAEGSHQVGLELVIQTVLQSPAFLYRFELGQAATAGQKLVRLTGYELAARLSYFLSGSTPSDALLDAAQAGELDTTEGVAAQARKLLELPRARAAVTEFYRQWLGLSELHTLEKDQAAHPEFTRELRSAMVSELPAFVEHVLWSADRRLTTLLTAPIGFVSGPLAEHYGTSASAGPSLSQLSLDPAERSGILTQAGVLAAHSLANQSSPVSRGKLVRERLLCQTPSPPPPNLDVTPPEVDPNLSTRERFAQHTESAECAGCHELMDPLGFAFESYDAVGRYRSSDGGRPIDTSGWISGSTDADGPFQNVRELSERLAQSRQVQDCVATQWFRYAFGRHEGPADACSLAEVSTSFSASSGDLYELLVALTQTEAFLHRRPLSASELTP